ncbi:hypothetical protein Tco_0116208 [Tanacetum coccineum]
MGVITLFEQSREAKEDLRKQYAECKDISLERCALIDKFVDDKPGKFTRLRKRCGIVSEIQDNISHKIGETRADVSAPDWSAYNIIVPSEADQSFADQSETDTSALVPSLSCALGAHVRKAL